MRAGITHILFAVRPEEDAKAIDAYLKSLEPVPSPHLVDGQLNAAAERGKKLFFNATVGCGSAIRRRSTATAFARRRQPRQVRQAQRQVQHAAARPRSGGPPPTCTTATI